MGYQTDFINKLAPLVLSEAKRSKILPSLTMAQACLETGFGKSLIGGNALFGIKGTGTISTTKEYIDGKWITIKDSFRDYSSWEESIADHSEFIHTVKRADGTLRYKAVIGETDYKKACKAIFDAGYATGKGYDMILVSIIEKYKLNEYDKRLLGKEEQYYIYVGMFSSKTDAEETLQKIKELPRKPWCEIRPIK